MSFTNQTYEGQQLQVPTSVIYTGTDTLRDGYVLTYDAASTGTAADVTRFGAVQAARNGRMSLATRPTIGAILTRQAAGVVFGSGPDGITGDGVGKVVSVLPIRPDGGFYNDVSVYTDQNVAVGDVLGLIPGEYFLGRAVIPGAACFIAREAADRSSTAGLVNGNFGFLPPDLLADKIAFFRDHFMSGTVGISGFTPAEVAAFNYSLRGTSAAAAFSTTEHGGALTITPNTTNIGQLEMPGFPCTLATGRSAWIRGRYKVANVDADTYFGLGINAAAVLTDGGYLSNLDDYFGFVSDGDTSSGAVVKFCYNKDNGTDRAITVISNFASDTYVDFAALIVNRNSGTTASSGAKYAKVFYSVAGVMTMLTGTASPSSGSNVTANGLIDCSDLFNDDEAMGLAVAGIGGAAARAVNIDRWELGFSM